MQSNADLLAGDIVGVTAAAKPAILLHPPAYRYFAMLRNKLRWTGDAIFTRTHP